MNKIELAYQNGRFYNEDGKIVKAKPIGKPFSVIFTSKHFGKLSLELKHHIPCSSDFPSEANAYLCGAIIRNVGGLMFNHIVPVQAYKI